MAIWKKAAQGLGSWSVDKLVESWPAIALWLAGGGLMTYLAAVSDWLSPYGPVAWGAAGLLSLLILASSFLVYALARQALAAATFVSLKAAAGKINTLVPVHIHESFNLADIVHPYYEPIRNARFEECEIYGPGNMVIMDGSSLIECGFNDCEVVIVRPGNLVGVSGIFSRCTLLRSRFYRVTLLMTREAFEAMPEEIQRGLPVVSEAIKE